MTTPPRRPKATDWWLRWEWFGGEGTFVLWIWRIAVPVLAALVVALLVSNPGPSWPTVAVAVVLLLGALAWWGRGVWRDVSAWRARRQAVFRDLDPPR